MSNSINLIKQAEREKREVPQVKRPRLADGFKFQTQPPMALDKFSPNDPAVNSEEKSSSGLMVDDSGSDKDCKQALREKHLAQLKKNGPYNLNRKSMQEVTNDCSPLMNEENYLQIKEQVLSPGESYTRQYNEQKLSSTDIFNDGFYKNEKGALMCENYQVSTIAQHMVNGASPFYLMSKGQLNKNYLAYEHALEGIDSFIGYAVKANHNLNLLKHLASLGSGAVLVSGCELQTAIIAGFSKAKMVFNGNGKTQQEINLAVEHEILINIDSEFDLEHIIQAGEQIRKKARAILRINPDIDPKVHPYVSTGLASSKFGIQNSKLPAYLSRIKDCSDVIELVGIHCHLGSTIKDVEIFRDAATLMVEFVKKIREEGFNLKYLNIGGGLGIDYERKGEQVIPTPMDLIDSIKDLIKDQNLKLIIEPGRSLVANTCVFVNRVTGVKSNGTKNFIVVDGSMSELIRPSLYDAYHHIEFANKIGGKTLRQDVVGPVCESADFLGKDRDLPVPSEGDILVVYDTGAYCQSMSSVYNMRLTCAEYWIEGSNLQMIRKPLKLMTYLDQFNCDSESENRMSSQSPSLYIQRKVPQIIKDNSSCDSKSSKENVSRHPQGSHSNQVKSALDIESITMIEECDEVDEINSPDRARGSHGLKFEFQDDNQVKLRQNSMNNLYRSSEDRPNKEDNISFYMEGSSSESYKGKEQDSEHLSADSKSYDSEEEDRKFLEKQQEEQMKKEFQQLEEVPVKIPFALDNIFKKKEVAKFTPEQEQAQDFDQFDEEQFQSPTFAKKGPITPQKYSNANKTVKKEAIQLIKSPIQFMSQRKMGRPAPFEIKTINYNHEDFRECIDEEMSLTQNNGGEIDVRQLTNTKKYGSSFDNDPKSSGNSLHDRGSFQGFSPAKTPGILKTSSAQPIERMGMRSSFPSSSQDVCKIGGIKGLGSAGIRLGSRVQPTSSTSSRRDAFRNKILQNKAGLSSMDQFNKYKNIDANSSCSSRFVTKLQGNDSDFEIMSQQENEYKNAFEKTYNEYESLGEGCSSVVKRCEHKILKQIRAVKIIRNDDPEYIQNAQNEYTILKNLNHSLIVKMYDCIHDFDKGTLYLIMEYIEGETIEDYALRIQNEKKGFVKESIIKKIFKQIVQAVEILHENGICHRDLKPDNVLYNSKTGNIKLMDFNISKRFRRDPKKIEDVKEDTILMPNRRKTSDLNGIKGISLRNQLNNPLVDFNMDDLKEEEEKEDESQPKRITMRTVTGLDMYSAPETRQGGEYTESIDYWGLGILLYYMVAGHPPFIDHDETRLKKKVQECKYEPFNQECISFYTQECFQLIKSLLVVEPGQRLNLQEIKETLWYTQELISPSTPQKKMSNQLAIRKISDKIPLMDLQDKKKLLTQEDCLQDLRNSLQPTDMNKKRDPAVIRNRQNNSREREIAERKFSFFLPTCQGGNNTPNLHLRGPPVMPDISSQKRGGSIYKIKQSPSKNELSQQQSGNDTPSKDGIIKLFQITPQGGYSSDEEQEPDDFVQSISFSNQNQKYIKQKTHTFHHQRGSKKENPTTDSGYEHERGGTFEIQMKKQMSSKMRKKSHRSRVDKKALDEKIKRKSHAYIDDQKTYKELQDFGIDSPQTLEEEKMDEMLLDNNK